MGLGQTSGHALQFNELINYYSSSQYRPQIKATKTGKYKMMEGSSCCVSPLSSRIIPSLSFHEGPMIIFMGWLKGAFAYYSMLQLYSKEKRLNPVECSIAPEGGTPHNGLYGEAPPERDTLFRLEPVYKRLGISRVEV